MTESSCRDFLQARRFHFLVSRKLFAMRYLSYFAALMLVIGLSAAANATAAEPSEEHAKLIGKWQAQKVTVNGEEKAPEGDAANGIEFTAEHILVGEQKIVYKVDTDTTPRLIDIEVKLGDQGNTRTLEGIYKIEEEQLTVCLYLAENSAQKRPDTFTSEEGSQRIMVTLKRDQ
jgi:uncharacterized protein (TIGR03067 family)